MGTEGKRCRGIITITEDLARRVDSSMDNTQREHSCDGDVVRTVEKCRECSYCR